MDNSIQYLYMAKNIVRNKFVKEIYNIASFLEDSSDKKSVLYRDVTLSGDNIILACVTEVGYISVITRSGKELYRIGTKCIRSPYGLCATSDCVYCTELFTHSVWKFSLAGELIARVGRRGKSLGEFNLPYGLAVDRTGILYVTDNRNHRVQVFTPDLELITAFGRNTFHRPSDVQCCVDGSLVVLDNSGRRLHKLSTDVYPVRTVDTNLTAVSDSLKTLFFPLFFCLDPSENILISDRYSLCIEMFDSNLMHMTSFTAPTLEFDPKGIVCDENGDVICLSDSGPYLRTFKHS